MTNALEISHLCKDYGAFRLDDLSLTLPGGAIMGLIGENGAGKSTTIKCILNLIRRDAGEIKIWGEDGAAHAREEIGVVLDEALFHDVLTPGDVDKILSKSYRSWDSTLFAQYLTQFALPRKSTLKTFSRGMKMKLSIAAALAHHPRLLLLDEATSGLDPVVRDDILDAFLGFIGDEEHAILVSSHIISDLEKVADYITFLHAGRVLLQESKDELLARSGRLVCTRAELEQVDAAQLAGVRVSQFSAEALVRDRRAFSARYPALTVDSVTLEEIMVFMVKGVRA